MNSVSRHLTNREAVKGKTSLRRGVATNLIFLKLEKLMSSKELARFLNLHEAWRNFSKRSARSSRSGLLDFSVGI